MNLTKEQTEAIEKSGTNILVSAGAGSGKTFVLSKRVIRIIKDGHSVDSLLILTFTKAAAKEMKERIRKRLSEDDNLKDELEKIDSAYIMTFDAFALSVVKKYHYLLDLPNDISITDDTIINLKQEQIIDEIFNELFTLEDKNFLKLINDYCFKDTTEIKKYLNTALNKLNLLYDEDNYLNTYIDNYYNDNNLNILVNTYLEIIKQKIISLENNLEQFKSVDTSDSYEIILKSLTNLFNSSSYEEIKFNSIITLPRLKNGSSEEEKTIKDNMKKILDEIIKLTSYSSENIMKEEILLTKDNVKTIIDIIKNVRKRLIEYQKENNLYAFTDIAKFSIKLVKDYPEVKDYYKHKFYEILIDEYQDTSDLQELFIESISHNNLYMVGDIKQSIYRFRNANPNIFKDKYSLYSALNGGIKIDLNKNFRSRKEVLNNINSIFSPIMDLFLGGSSYRNNQELIFGNNEYDNFSVDVNNQNMEILTYDRPKKYEFSNKEIEVFLVAQDIENKIKSGFQVYDNNLKSLRNVSYNDFAILIDQSSSFELFKKIFSYKHLPLSINHDESIKDNIDLNIIKNILHLTLLIQNNTYDETFKYSYLALKRSFLAKTDDNELFRQIINHKWYEDQDFKSLQKLSKLIPTMSIYPFLKEIINTFNYYDKLILIGDINSHIYVLDNILNISNSVNNLYSISEFYDYLEHLNMGDLDLKLSYPDDNQNSIKLMTIHGSKGLEFPICYFCDLAHSLNDKELKQNFTFNSQDGFIIPLKQENLNEIITEKISENNFYKEEISEKIRLFYVALTRAKEKMILISPTINTLDSNNNLLVDNEIRLKYRSFYDMLSSIQKELTPYMSNINLDQLNLTKKYKNKIKIEKLISDDGQKIKVQENNYNWNYLEDKHFSKIKNELKEHDEIEKLNEGLKVHAILENINLKNINYDNIDLKYLPLIKKFVSQINSLDIINEYHEYEFMYELDNIIYHGIIDLLIETKDSFIIYDYKLKNTLDDAYLTQLKGYKSYLQTLTKKKIKVYLYSIVDGTLRGILDD